MIGNNVKINTVLAKEGCVIVAGDWQRMCVRESFFGKNFILSDTFSSPALQTLQAHSHLALSPYLNIKLKYFWCKITDKH